MTNCPTCDSPAPNLHPAVQHEGEVQGCDDDFHGDHRQRPGESLRDMSRRLYGPAATREDMIPQVGDGDIVSARAHHRGDLLCCARCGEHLCTRPRGHDQQTHIEWSADTGRVLATWPAVRSNT
jgi:hypothetical protein